MPPAHTPQQHAVVNAAVIEFIQRYQEANGFPPSRREIAQHLGQVPSTAQLALERMVREGLLTVTPGAARGIRLTGAAMKHPTETL